MRLCLHQNRSSRWHGNRCQGTFGSGMASINFIRKGFISWKEVFVKVIYTFIGAALGTYAILLMDATLLAKIVLAMLVGIFIYTLLKKKLVDTILLTKSGTDLKKS